jgi:hypothetical protein
MGEPPSELVVLAARHLDDTENMTMGAGHELNGDDVAAIRTVIAYVARQHEQRDPAGGLMVEVTSTMGAYPPGTPVPVRRRSRAGRLRYLADRLRRGEHPDTVAVALDTEAEMEQQQGH